MRRVLFARLDSMGDLLLAGPALRAVAASSDELTLLCSPRTRAAADLMPGVDRVHTFSAPWIEPEPRPFDRYGTSQLVDWIRRRHLNKAIIATSFHQSSLPLALLLRAAGVHEIVAYSDDYPGSLLDCRVPDPGDVHEVERNLVLAGAAGHPSDELEPKLAIRRAGGVPPSVPAGSFVVVHPGASCAARTWSPAGFAEAVAELEHRGHQVVVTGGRHERRLTAHVAAGGEWAVDLGGRLDLPELAAVLAAADVVVCGNTGPAHLAAAVGTPVVSLFPPTVPAVRWRPWGVPHRLLGSQDVSCRGCRARECPLGPSPSCLASVTAADVADAVDGLRASTPLEQCAERS